MTESDPHYWATLLHNAWIVFLAMWGGLVAYYQRFVKGKTAFSWLMLGGEMVTSALAGLLAFYGCLELELSGPVTAITVALSGLGGGNLLKICEEALQRRFARLIDHKADHRDRGPRE